MSKEILDPPKPLTTEEIMGEWDEQMERILSDIAEMKAKIQECLKTGPQPSKVNEVEQLKQEIVELKKENADLKQQLKDLWNSFSTFFEKHASNLSNKWSAFFAKNKDSKVENVATENHNTLKV